ncbi:prepilin-type N-terminal cleavage/methylation domain-containing protein [Apilactobacillus zhangqiuensis]|uniref:prepilin-type N-terminal cleavage/methylation domain-containing protein n=1 Tax=Apilactobacillus zhangqiuensis TaxID=2841031 RepID=UPI001C7CEBF2|nr:prepilin-type N-terminal cleavage/methylation domain-containing protein [Apilactobacillus zhangqiuensis]
MWIIKLWQKNKNAFTTIEMLIVLVISSIFMSLCIFLYHGMHVSDKELEKEFWINFRVYWRQAIENSEYTKSLTTIYATKHEIIFFNKGHHYSLRMPDSMWVQDRLLIYINGDGYSAPKTFRWYSKKTNTRYLVKIQLGGETYRLDETYYE